MTLITGAGVLAVVAYTSVAAWQGYLQSSTLQEMQAEQRPWVSAAITPTGSVIDVRNLGGVINPHADGHIRNDDGGRVNFKVVLTNVGHTPAYHVTLWLEGYVFGRADAESAQHALCDPVMDIPLSPENRGNALLPGETREYTQIGVQPYAGWSTKDARELGFDLDGHHRIMMFAYGCIDYVFGNPVQHHQTGFVYMLDTTKFVLSGEDTNSIPSDVPLADGDIKAYPYITNRLRTD